MRVVKDLLKANHGRPFFVCSDQSNSCYFWVWDNVWPVARSREEVLKETEKYNKRIPPEVKIIASKIEGPTRQRVNPVLTEEQEAAWRE